MLHIEEIKRIDEQIEEFEKMEWQYADIDHFGRKINWEKKKIILKAIEENQIVGVLELIMQAGVMHIEGLIIQHDKYGQGIGKSLMEEAEKIARRNHLHKIYLETGKTWKATKFYEILGYKITGELPNHMEHQDYLEYSKFLNS